METHRKGPRYKRRGQVNRPDQAAISTQLRSARDFVLRREYPQALSALNTLLIGRSPDPTTGRILSVVADVQYAQGKFSDAAAAYKAAQVYVAAEPEAWFRPVFGEVSSLLKNVQVKAAAQRALDAFTDAQTKENAWQAQAAVAQGALAQGKVAQIPAQPIRASVVASRLGRLFLNEGEVAVAKQFFGLALQINPQGACRARLGLAEIALQESQPETAATLAGSALSSGIYRAKTIPAWNLLITARLQQGLPALDQVAFAGLPQATPSVRSRAIMAIVTALRGAGDPAWKTITQNWLDQEGSGFPIVSASLRQTLVAESKKTTSSDPTALAATANDLLNTPGLSPSEWIIAAKQSLRITQAQSIAATASSLIAQGVTAYGVSLQSRILCGLVPVVIANKNRPLAKSLLGQVVSLDHADAFWRKGIGMLARAEAYDGNFQTAAGYYQLAAQDAHTPLRCQFAYQVRWAKCLVNAGQLDAILSAKDRLLAIINSSQDYKAALDLAHVLIDAPAELNTLASTLAAQGTALAMRAYQAASTPGSAASILMYLARRQADFGQYPATVAAWEGLSDTTKLWLWSANADYWEYVSWVFRAYRDGGNANAALIFADQYLSDSATPLMAVAMLSSLKGVQLMLTKNTASGMAALQRGIGAQPTNKYCAYGYYWQALDAYNRQANTDVQSFTNRITTTIGNCPILHWQKSLTLAAACLSADLNPSGVSVGKYSAGQIARQIADIQNDIQCLT